MERVSTQYLVAITQSPGQTRGWDATAARVGFTGYWVLGTGYWVLIYFLVALPSIIVAHVAPSIDISNLNV